jgi:hypothetical protein
MQLIVMYVCVAGPMGRTKHIIRFFRGFIGIEAEGYFNV